MGAGKKLSFLAFCAVSGWDNALAGNGDVAPPSLGGVWNFRGDTPRRVGLSIAVLCYFCE